MLSECNIEKIGTKDAKVILAAIDFYARDLVVKQKNRVIKSRKADSLIEELISLKKKVEFSETSEGITVKESILLKEEQQYRALLKSGKTEEELQGVFMYKELLKK